jgi:vacuolar-type H+-ATPase subunit E/Vma4
MRSWGSAAAVVAAVRDDAAAERERLERESAATLDTLSAGRVPRSGEREQDAGTERMDAVRRVNAEADAAEDWEDTVTAASDRDAWIAAVAEKGRRAIAADTDAQKWLERVTREAVAELPGDACIVAVPATLAAEAEVWRSAVERDTGKRIALEPAAFTAGCIARTPDGRVTFDNTVDARERRSRTEWRTAVARIYDAATVPASAPAEVA